MNDIDEKKEICFQCSAKAIAEGKVCSFLQDYITDDEVSALSVLRQLKEHSIIARDRVKELDKIIDFALFDKGSQQLTSEERTKQIFHAQLYPEWNECNIQLEQLRSQWRAWDGKRKEANKIKMILLGHAQ
jgi:hypothetical protein